MGRAFFPLDEELGLGPGSLTPHAYECLVRLGVRVPSFGQAADELAATLKVRVSEAMVRRQTEAAGAAYEAIQTAEVEWLEQAIPPAPVGAARLQVSADGAMVPLVGGDWTEVKTVAIGQIGQGRRSNGEWGVRTEQISYFSRRSEAQQFNRLALGEVHRRGVEQADLVAAPADGAEWIQGFLDYHCPEAIRILDFAHAAERIAEIGQACLTPDDLTPWLKAQLHQLKHDGPATVLAELQRLQETQPTLPLIVENLAYLQKRQDHMLYPTFQAQGLPIGSGSVESAHKVVVEPRLKGAGMHWAPDHVNPMVALRTLLCNDRWADDWPKIVAHLRRQVSARKRALQQKHQHLKLARLLPPAPMTEPPAQFPDPPEPPEPPALPKPLPPSTPPPKPKPYRPAPDHPWRHSTVGRARFQPYQPANN